MRGRRRSIGGIAGGLGLLAFAVVAHGDGAAPTLAGWTACPDAAGCLARGTARLEIRRDLGADAVEVTRKALAGEVVHDEDTTIAGKPGHLLVAFGDALTAAAVVDGTAVVLQAPLAETRGAIHAWAALVEAQGAAAAGPGGTLRVVNVDPDCAATYYVDGEEHTLEAGASADVALAGGRAFVEWQERDGDHRMAAAAPGAEAHVGCVAPKVEAPLSAMATAATPSAVVDAAVVAAAVDAAVVAVGATDGGAAVPETLENADADAAGPHAALEPAFAGARSAVLFYRGLWGVVVMGKMWDEPRSLDRLMLKLLQHRPRDRWDALVAYSSLYGDLERAAKLAAGDTERMAALRRVATEILLSMSQAPTQRGCASASAIDALADTARTDAVDCNAKSLGRMGTGAKDVAGLRMLNAAALDPPSGDIATRLSELAK